MNRSEPDSLDTVLDADLAKLLSSDAARLDHGADGAGDPAAARRVVKQFRSREQRRRAIVVAASVISLAAATTLTLRLRAPSAAPQASNPALSNRASSRFKLQSGHATAASGREVTPDQPLAAGLLQLAAGACVATTEGRLCAASPGGAIVALPTSSERQLVSLQAGGLSAELFSAASGFEVGTIHGQVVSIKSALLTLALDGSGAFTTLSVQSGSARYHDVVGAQAELVAGQSVRLRLPASPPAAPTVGVEQRSPEIAPDTGARALTPADAASSATSPGELLELARRERAARRYSAAALAYRKLEQTFPGSPEARAALVSLGQLQLGQLGQPAAALRSFQAYLAAPGQLQQEAEHGSILALQKLGRKAEERRAIEAFVARYPKSVQAGVLKERLEQL